MLGTRTRKVSTYGKRSQRIINVAEQDSIFDDLPPPTYAPVASRMKKRSENLLVLKPKPKPSSPKQISVNKKKQSPISQPLRQKLMRAQMDRKISNPKHASVEGTPTRAPLAMYHTNTPGSPAIPSNISRKKARVSAVKRTPLRKTRSPVIEVDIIVQDDDGHTISHERRVSRGKGSESASLSGNTSTELSETDSPQPKSFKRKRLYGNRDLVVSSDDEEHVPASPSGLSTAKPLPKPMALPSNPSRKAFIPRPHNVVEVVIPPPSPNLAAVMQSYLRPKEFPEPRSPSPPPAVFNQGVPHLAKTRKLTPIRGRGRGLFHPPSPPSPLSDSDLDLSLDLSNMDLGTDVADGPPNPPAVIPEYLQPLLEECQQDKTGLHEFSAFIESFSFDPVVRSSRHGGAAKDLKFKKVGEASYSEVFGIGDVVLKVIPLRDESPASLFGSQRSLKARLSDLAEGPAPSDARDVLKEIIVTRAMGEVCERFVKLLKTYVVRGRYPEVLLELWDQYHQQHGSESVRPDSFGVSQAYAIIVLPNGGPDLEAYTFSSASKRWRQACSIFWQVTKALARAEQLVSFEHRDLHWGQILIKDLPSPTNLPMQEQKLNAAPRAHAAKAAMDDASHGVRVTVIDLGLARMDAGDGCGGEMVHWTPFDDEVFMSEGEYQFDVYRMMREENGNKWEPFNPLTNVMWLHYLLLKLLRSKRLRAPAAPRKGQPMPTSASHFNERECYECLVDLEHWLDQYTSSVLSRTKMTKAKKKAVTSKASASSIPFCAGEIVEYGSKKGWVKALSN